MSLVTLRIRLELDLKQTEEHNACLIHGLPQEMTNWKEGKTDKTDKSGKSDKAGKTDKAHSSRSKKSTAKQEWLKVEHVTGVISTLRHGTKERKRHKGTTIHIRAKRERIPNPSQTVPENSIKQDCNEQIRESNTEYVSQKERRASNASKHRRSLAQLKVSTISTRCK